MTTITLILKHGQTGQMDVQCELTKDKLVLTECNDRTEYGNDLVTLDRWQIMKLQQVLSLWVDQEQI